MEFFTRDGADQLASADTDHHPRDLFESTARGDHPSWTLFVQVVPFDGAEGYRFNPFDLTKVWAARRPPAHSFWKGPLCSADHHRPTSGMATGAALNRTGCGSRDLGGHPVGTFDPAVRQAAVRR